MNRNLNEISKPIKQELKNFEEFFKESLKSKVGLVDLVTRYIIKQKGKKIRPLLVFLSAQAAGGVNERTYRGAVLVELLHTATLVHDDVVDNADKRRGLPSINAVWKNKVAVLMGDYLLSRGLMIAVEGEDYDFLHIITETVKKMSEGELLQIQKTRKLDIDEATYFKVISQKTASLFQTCCAIGAMSGSDNPDYHHGLKMFGENLGMSFQIKDDILDYDGSSKLFGKPIGGDIKEKKITLPLIHALNKVSAEKSNQIKKIIKNGGKKDGIKEVIEFVHQQKGIDYAGKTAKEFSLLAQDYLSIFPETEAKSSLLDLAEFILIRKS